MEFGSINLVVNDPDEALKTYLKLFGTNNVPLVIKVRGWNDTVDMVDGYFLKTTPVALGIYRPRSSTGKMGAHLATYGEGIYNIDLHMGQDEFQDTYTRFKSEGRPVSPKIIYCGRFSEALFWLDESGEQGVPVRYMMKAYHGLKLWEQTEYIDTPQRVTKMEHGEDFPMPRVTLGTIMVTVRDWEKQQKVWADILSLPAIDTGNLSTLEKGKVDDGRGNIFVPVKYRFSGGGAVNLYCALNEEAPINKILRGRNRDVMYHNMCGYVVRDKTYDYWRRLDEAGFCMVDPKPMLNDQSGNGNYFYFVHPVSTHGVLFEIVSAYGWDDEKGIYFDWSDTELNMVSPSLNDMPTAKETE